MFNLDCEKNYQMTGQFIGPAAQTCSIYTDAKSLAEDDKNCICLK